MKPTIRFKCALALLISGILAAGPALADKPPGKGKGKGADEYRGEQRDRDERSAERRHFEERHRAMVRDYYADLYRGGRCPPGLAKKHNGCMPPGQARKWELGRPLPRDVVFYEVPHQLVIEIGAPPPGYRYVRVAGDILMIAIATGMVIDAIQDLGR